MGSKFSLSSIFDYLYDLYFPDQTERQTKATKNLMLAYTLTLLLVTILSSNLFYRENPGAVLGMLSILFILSMILFALLNCRYFEEHGTKDMISYAKWLLLPFALETVIDTLLFLLHLPVYPDYFYNEPSGIYLFFLLTIGGKFYWAVVAGMLGYNLYRLPASIKKTEKQIKAVLHLKGTNKRKKMHLRKS